MSAAIRSAVPSMPAARWKRVPGAGIAIGTWRRLVAGARPHSGSIFASLTICAQRSISLAVYAANSAGGVVLM